jgi:hypothetical protein
MCVLPAELALGSQHISVHRQPQSLFSVFKPPLSPVCCNKLHSQLAAPITIAIIGHAGPNATPVRMPHL